MLLTFDIHFRCFILPRLEETVAKVRLRHFMLAIY